MVKSLKMKNVRCFDHFEIDFDNKLTYIYGKNGSGKTTILEAIYLISTGKSFRSQDDSTMIENDKNYAEINLETSHDNFRIVLTRKGKRIWINKKEVRKLSDFVGKLKPGDSPRQLVHGAKSAVAGSWKRRWMIVEN